MRIQRVSALALTLGLTSAGAGLAQTPKPSPAPPVFGASVSVVTVPVFVRDKDGQTPSGLSAADFEVTDDGRPMKIVGLQEIDAAQPLPALTPREAAAAHRQFLLLFDLSFTSSSGLVRAQEAAASFVRNGMGPSDLAAVATLTSRTGLKLLLGFTADREQLARAVDALGSRDLDRKSDPLGLVYSFAPVGDAAVAEGRARKQEALQDEMRVNQVLFRRQDDASYRREVGSLLQGLSQLASTLDAVQGRKQILYFSAGFDQTALIGAQGAEARSSGEAVVEGRLWEVDSESRFGDSGIRDQMQNMVRAFSGSDVVVHAIDITGLAARGDASAQAQGEETIGSGRESLNQIAQGTGGRFIKDANDLNKALGEILDSTRRYYVLAYEPQAVKGPGKFHRMKVRPRAKGLSASHRTGWIEASAEPQKAPLAGRLEAAEAVVKGLSGGEIETRIVAVPYRNVDGKVSLVAVLQVDGRSLLAHRDGSMLPLEIYGYAIGADGTVEDAVSLTSTLTVDKVQERLTHGGLQLQAAFSVAPGRHSLRFLVRDAEKGRRGFRTMEVEVPPFEAGNLVVYPPLFMDDPSRRIVLQTSSRVGGAPEMPFHVGTDMFTPEARPRLANGRTESVCVMAYDGNARYETGAQFEIKAQLIDTGGAPVRIGKLQLAKALAETDGFRRFVLNVTPADVPTGEYRFKIKVRDPLSGQVRETEQAVEVE